MTPAHHRHGREIILRVDFAVLRRGTRRAGFARPAGRRLTALHGLSGTMDGAVVGADGIIGFGGAGDFGGLIGLGSVPQSQRASPLLRAVLSSAPLRLSGRIGCWSMPMCNRRPSSFGSDAGGHALTQWTENGLTDTGCTSPNGDHPQWLVNTTYGGRIGAYIDNEVDEYGRGTEERQYLVDCVYAQGYGVILVGLYPSETSTYFLVPNDNGFAGGMLQWYPYCNGAYAVGYAEATSDPPPLEDIMASGYIVQKHYDNECRVGPSCSQHRSEWSYAWREVDNDGGDGIYNDLIAGY